MSSNEMEMTIEEEILQEIKTLIGLDMDIKGLNNTLTYSSLPEKIRDLIRERDLLKEQLQKTEKPLGEIEFILRNEAARAGRGSKDTPIPLENITEEFQGLLREKIDLEREVEEKGLTFRMAGDDMRRLRVRATRAESEAETSNKMLRDAFEVIDHHRKVLGIPEEPGPHPLSEVLSSFIHDWAMIGGPGVTKMTGELDKANKELREYRREWMDIFMSICRSVCLPPSIECSRTTFNKPSLRDAVSSLLKDLRDAKEDRRVRGEEIAEARGILRASGLVEWKSYTTLPKAIKALLDSLKEGKGDPSGENNPQYPWVIKDVLDEVWRRFLGELNKPETRDRVWKETCKTVMDKKELQEKLYKERVEELDSLGDPL